jgi:t-SNARE complex subunit (syntaxin)
MQQELISSNHLQEREQDINKLEHGIQEVSDLFMDMSLLVSYQGEKIDNIETNITSTLSSTNNANKQLVKASRYQQKKRACLIRLMCFFFSIIIIIIIIIVSTSNN